MKRSGKFYRRNEKEVMNLLGFKPTINSGSGWIEKEDGINEFAICQLKSTDATSIRIKKQDLNTLENNAAVSNKIPVFAFQFIETNEIWIAVKPDDANDLSSILKNKKIELRNCQNLINFKELEQEMNEKENQKIKKIKSNSSERELFHNEKEKMYRKEKSAK